MFTAFVENVVQGVSSPLRPCIWRGNALFDGTDSNISIFAVVAVVLVDVILAVADIVVMGDDRDVVDVVTVAVVGV